MTDASVAEMSDAELPESRGIFDGFSGYVTPTPGEWQNVLTNGLVVLDTNVLLNLYRYNQDARESLLKVVDGLGARLWVPNQVMVEFWRNRDSALDDPERQLQQSTDALRVNLNKSVTELRGWVNRVSLDHVRAVSLEGKLKDAFEEVISSMERVVDAGGFGTRRETHSDEIITALSVLLDGKVGGPLDSVAYDSCVAEGKRRLENLVPPGYKDKKKEGRGEDAEIGDYLVWYQLIQEAKQRSRDVLLVTGDTKEDWWRIRNRMTVGPRNELSEELLREAGVRLYMLRPDRLLVLARDLLEVSVSEDSVQNVEMVDAQSTSAPDGQMASAWSYPALVSVLSTIRKKAPNQELAIAAAVANGGYISAESLRSHLSSGRGPERMALRYFEHPVLEASWDAAAEQGVSVFQPSLLVPIYSKNVAGSSRVEGFQVDVSLHGMLRKAWGIANESSESNGEDQDEM